MEFWLEWDIMSSYFTSMIGECVLPLQQHNSLIIQPKGMVVRNIYHICQEQMGVSQEHPAEQHHFYTQTPTNSKHTNIYDQTHIRIYRMRHKIAPSVAWDNLART